MSPDDYEHYKILYRSGYFTSPLRRDLGETLAPLAKSLKLKNSESRTFAIGSTEIGLNAHLPRDREDPELEELNSAIEEVRHNTLILESRRNCLNEKLLKKEKKERKKEKKEKKKKKIKSSAENRVEKEVGRRKIRSDSVQLAPHSQGVLEEALETRRFSEPFEPLSQPLIPSPHESPLLPPQTLAHSLESPVNRERTPSPIPQDRESNPPETQEDQQLFPTMDEDSVDIPLPEVAQSPADAPHLPQLQPELEPEEFLPEVQRQPPIVFKEEIDVSSRGHFDPAWSSPYPSFDMSPVLSSSPSSSLDENYDDDSSLSSFSSFSSSNSSSSFSSCSSSYQSSRDSNSSALISSQACFQSSTLPASTFVSDVETDAFQIIDDEHSSKSDTINMTSSDVQNCQISDHLSNNITSDFPILKTEMDIVSNTLRNCAKKDVSQFSLDKPFDKFVIQASKKLSPQKDNIPSSLCCCGDSSSKMYAKSTDICDWSPNCPIHIKNVVSFGSAEDSSQIDYIVSPFHFNHDSGYIDTSCNDKQISESNESYSTALSSNRDSSPISDQVVQVVPFSKRESSPTLSVTNVSFYMMPIGPRPPTLPVKKKRVQVSENSNQIISKDDSAILSAPKSFANSAKLCPEIHISSDSKMSFPSTKEVSNDNFNLSEGVDPTSKCSSQPKRLSDKCIYNKKHEKDKYSSLSDVSLSQNQYSPSQFTKANSRPNKLQINTSTHSERKSSSSLSPQEQATLDKCAILGSKFPITTLPNSAKFEQPLNDPDSGIFLTPDSNINDMGVFIFDSATYSKSKSEYNGNSMPSSDTESLHTANSSCSPPNFDIDIRHNSESSSVPNSFLCQDQHIETKHLNNIQSSSPTDLKTPGTILSDSAPPEQENISTCENQENCINSNNSSVSPFVSVKSSYYENNKSEVLPLNLPPPYEDAISITTRQTSDPLLNNESSDSSISEEFGLSRSATESSVSSATSFGSSYYTLYIVDPLCRPRTPDDVLWSPESSPPPEDLSRSASTTSVSSFCTITPEPEYFEENTRAFRAMRGLSMSSSNESILTCFSRSNSEESNSTLHQESLNSHSRFDQINDIQNDSTLYENDELESSQTSLSLAYHSQASPNQTSNFNPNSSLESMHSVLRNYPSIKSPFCSISTFGLASCSPSPSPNPYYGATLERPSSTDSPIFFDSPSGSQESLLLFRPLPRYFASSLSPEPNRTVLCYLGPARPFEKPLTFTNIFEETVADFDGFVHYAAEMLSSTEQKHMEELRAYIIEDEGSWALGEDFNMLFARIFHDPSIPMEAQRHLIRIMAAAALKDDVILMLHQDRKEHTIMNFANKVESFAPHIQEALALFFCNMFEHMSPSEWLLYISEWTEGTQQISNIRVTTKIAVNALLHRDAKVQEYGTALMYNLGTKEAKTVIFDDVAPELAMAILQFFANNPPEEYVWRVMTALCRFCYASSEVPALIKMIGPDPNSFKGMSERIDVVLEEINAKLSRVRQF